MDDLDQAIKDLRASNARRNAYIAKLIFTLEVDRSQLIMMKRVLNGENINTEAWPAIRDECLEQARAELVAEGLTPLPA